jgi:predicted transcriptional regulator
MNLTLDIDDEIVAKVSRIAEARDMTVEAMVVEYLTGIATSPATSRLERIAKMREAIESAEEKAGILNLNREDIYDRPYRHYYGE